MAVNAAGVERVVHSETPKVDVGLLCSNSLSPEANQELDKLRVILSLCGYIQVVNHGIEASFLDELCDVSKRFFALPPEEKQKYSGPEAAAGFDTFLNDQIVIGNQILNRDDRLCLNLCPSDQRTLKAWPENPKEFRKILLECSKKVQKLNGIILKSMAKSLNLEENCFVKQYGENPTLLAKFNSHPHLSSSQQPVLGSRADASGLTFLVQDQVEAIEVQIDDQWFRIPLTRHAILVIVGDQAEIMSNGIFKSRIHSFVTNTDKEWMSLSVFCSPDSRNDIGPAEELINENRPRLYKNVVDYTVPPPQYIVKDSRFGLVDRSPSSAAIPIIDASLLLSSLPASAEELEKLRSALRAWGCFQLIGHGMAPSYLKKVLNATREFFELPIEQKNKYSRRSADDGEGYGGDVVVSENQILDWSNRLVLKVLPEDVRRLELWPEMPNDFREGLHEYPLKAKGILDLPFRTMAKLLNLEEEDSFLKQFGEGTLLNTSFRLYPPCKRPNEVLGLKPHSDKSGMTVLLQDDEVEGLQILNDNKWFKVPLVPHALLINVGDQMQIMSNGIMKSPVHRVVVNPERRRVSVSITNEAEKNKEIGPAPELIDDNRPRLYRNVKNYGAMNMECFQKGEVAIETVVQWHHEMK